MPVLNPNPSGTTRLRRVLLATTFVVVGSLLVVGAASAQNSPPPDDTALIDQYLEKVPTGSGSSDGSGGGGGGGGGSGGSGDSGSLSPAVSSGLERSVGKKNAAALKRIATSPRYGAPTAAQMERMHGDSGGGGLPTDATTSPVSAAIGALSGGDSGGRPIALLIALLLVTTLLAGAGFLRRRGGPTLTA